MLKKLFVATAVSLALSSAALGAEVTLKLHQFLPAPAPVPKNFMAPWAQKVEKESNGRIKVELYPSMQLGGKPPALFDQVRDGFVDIIWTLPGYTPGRFPKTEVFEMPFMPSVSAEATSKAAWEFYEANLQDEFKDVKIIAVHVHGPGIMHVKGNGVRKLEDMQGLKLRGPTRMVNGLIGKLGATPVGMPVPAVPESLSKGVIDGTMIPWEVVKPLKIHELVNTHTMFSGDRALYTSFFIFAMNKAKYESLPADLKKVIDDNSGLETSAWAGRVMGEGDIPGEKAARERGNEIIVLDDAETARWKEASKTVVEEWIVEMKGKGVDGAALYEQAVMLVDKHAK